MLIIFIDILIKDIPAICFALGEFVNICINKTI